jgi:DNA adenine methylase Dam
MYIEGVLNYTGSKFKLLDQILPKMDYSKKYFVDLFTGSFVVGANVVDKYDKVLANDIIGELIGIHKGLLESDDIIEKTKLLCPSKEDQESFLKLRESFNNEKSPEKLWALMLCSTNNMMRFNQSYKYNQTFGKRSYNSNTEKKVEIFKNHIRPYKNKIYFSSKHFNEIPTNKDCMVYIDSPYSNSEAGYNSYWKKDDDIKLYEYCKKINKIGASFMLSGILGEHKDDIRWELIDKLISDGFKYIELDCNYNKVSKNGEKNSKEIIIMNYE